MVATKELPISTVKASWIAIVYNPAKERDSQFSFDELTGQTSTFRPPIGRYISFPIAPPIGHKPGEAIPTLSIFLRVGANLTDSKNSPISATDWTSAVEADKEKVKRNEIPALNRLIERGVFQVFTPDIVDVGNPGYRHFNSGTAIQLINATTHENWLDDWMQAETRAEIIKAASEQRQRIIAAKKRQAS